DSPYHHVRDGAAYPPVLFLTGANDPRVDPMQSRKMTARLQAAGARVLLRTSAGSGHGIGTALDERIEQETDVLAFLFKELGMTLPPEPPPPVTLRCSTSRFDVCRSRPAFYPESAACSACSARGAARSAGPTWSAADAGSR